MFVFVLREAPSDIAGANVLGSQAGIPIAIDYALAAGAPLAVVGQFVTPSLGLGRWTSGIYTVALAVVAAESIAVAVELWQVDANGNPVQQIGARTANQTAAAGSTLSFEITGQQLATLSTDRLALTILAQNTDAKSSHGLSIMASQSSVATPIVKLRPGPQSSARQVLQIPPQYYRIQTWQLTAGTWTPIAVPLDCNFFSVINKGETEVTIASNQDDPTTQDTLVPGAAEEALYGENENEIGTVSRFRNGDVLFYATVASGAGTLSGRFLM
jgi:hypothetical protein